jgi:hypothetical protein
MRRRCHARGRKVSEAGRGPGREGLEGIHGGRETRDEAPGRPRQSTRLSWVEVMATSATVEDKVRWVLSFGEDERYHWGGGHRWASLLTVCWGELPDVLGGVLAQHELTGGCCLLCEGYMSSIFFRCNARAKLSVLQTTRTKKL